MSNNTNGWTVAEGGPASSNTRPLCVYGGPWVAERHAAIGEFMREHAQVIHVG